MCATCLFCFLGHWYTTVCLDNINNNSIILQAVLYKLANTSIIAIAFIYLPLYLLWRSLLFRNYRVSKNPMLYHLWYNHTQQNYISVPVHNRDYSCTCIFLYCILQIVWDGKVLQILWVNWQTQKFTVRHFHLVLKVAGHGPGSSLKNTYDLLSALGKVSGIMLPSQNY